MGYETKAKRNGENDGGPAKAFCPTYIQTRIDSQRQPVFNETNRFAGSRDPQDVRR